MKFAFAVVVVLGLVAYCQSVPLPDDEVVISDSPVAEETLEALEDDGQGHENESPRQARGFGLFHRGIGIPFLGGGGLLGGGGGYGGFPIGLGFGGSYSESYASSRSFGGGLYG